MGDRVPDHDLDDPDYVHRASRVELSELVHALCVSGRGWTPDRVALAKAALASLGVRIVSHG